MRSARRFHLGDSPLLYVIINFSVSSMLTLYQLTSSGSRRNSPRPLHPSPKILTSQFGSTSPPNPPSNTDTPPPAPLRTPCPIRRSHRPRRRQNSRRPYLRSAKRPRPTEGSRQPILQATLSRATRRAWRLTRAAASGRPRAWRYALAVQTFMRFLKKLSLRRKVLFLLTVRNGRSASDSFR